MARWVLPVPGLPTSSTFSLCSIYSPRINSLTSVSLIEGWALKSKVSMVLTTGNAASLMRRSVARRSRSINSRSASRSRNAG